MWQMYGKKTKTDNTNEKKTRNCDVLSKDVVNFVH